MGQNSAHCVQCEKSETGGDPGRCEDPRRSKIQDERGPGQGSGVDLLSRPLDVPIPRIYPQTMPTRTATRPSRAGRIQRRPNGNGNANNAGIPASARTTATPPRIRNGRAAAALVSLCLLVLAALPAVDGSTAAVVRGGGGGRGADRRGSRASSEGEQR